LKRGTETLGIDTRVENNDIGMKAATFHSLYCLKDVFLSSDITNRKEKMIRPKLLLQLDQLLLLSSNAPDSMSPSTQLP